MYLTKKQKKLVQFLGQFIEEEGYSPSLEEIAQGLGLSSVATVHKHLKNLEAKGFLERQWNHSRSLKLTPAASDLLGKPAAEAVKLPLLGRIAAGSPIEAINDNESLSVPTELLGRGRTYVLKVEGNSMIDEQIRDGDYVLVEERKKAHNGETVVALIRGEETTLKKFYREKENIRLQPANEMLEPIYLDPEEMEIRGVVVGLFRKYGS